MRPNWKPGTKIVRVMKPSSHDSHGIIKIEGVNTPKVREIVTVHSKDDKNQDCFRICEYLIDPIDGMRQSFDHHRFRKVVEIDSEVSEALSELTVQERSDIVPEPVNA